MKRLLVLLLLFGCVDPTVRCLQSHEETHLMPMFIGKTTILMPQTYSYCDVYIRVDTATGKDIPGSEWRAK